MEKTNDPIKKLAKDLIRYLSKVLTNRNMKIIAKQLLQIIQNIII